MSINILLSYWAALVQCPCGTWTFQMPSGLSPEGICWERHNPETGRAVRTWRAVGSGANRTFEFIGPDRCVTCGWDLTQSPRDNIKAIPAETWAGTIVGSDFGHEGTDIVDILPAGVVIEFDGCILDNVQLGETHTMVSKRNSARGVLCSHNRLHAQADGEDWICRWKDANGKRAGSPVQPVDKARLQAEGRNVDPDRIAARGV